MTTATRRTIDLWIDDRELDEIAASFSRIVERTRTTRPRSPFFVDYAEVE